MSRSAEWTLTALLSLLTAVLVLVIFRLKHRDWVHAPLLRAAVILSVGGFFMWAFSAVCYAGLPTALGFSLGLTMRVGRYANWVAVLVLMLSSYLMFARMFARADLDFPIPHWLQRMAIRDDDGENIRHSAEYRDDER